MQLHELKPQTPRKRKKRIGRGGKRGTYSGRGLKGQKARAGRKLRPQERDVIKKFPKLRGRGTHALKSIVKKPVPVNLSVLEKTFSAGDTVTPTTLFEKGVIERQSGRLPTVKVLGSGTLTKALAVSDTTVSQGARAAIEKAGGSVSATS